LATGAGRNFSDLEERKWGVKPVAYGFTFRNLTNIFKGFIEKVFNILVCSGENNQVQK
jgi:hypothetical protein